MDPLTAQIFLDRLVIFLLALTAALAAGGLTVVFLYLLIVFFRLKKRESISLEMVTLEASIPKDNEIKIDAAAQMFSSLASFKKGGFFSFLEVDDLIAFEIVGKKADIRFYVSAPEKIIDVVEKAIYGYYPSIDLKRVDEPNIFAEKGKVKFGGFVKKESPYYPIKIYKDLATDPLSALTSTLSKLRDDEGMIIQFLVRATSSNWQKQGRSYVSMVKKREADPEKASFKVDARALERIEDQAAKVGFETAIRYVVSAPTKEAVNLYSNNIVTAFSQFNSDLNRLTKAKYLFKGLFMINFIYKFFPVVKLPFFKTTSIFTFDELATLFHFPNKTIETPYIKWLKAKTAPVPAEIPRSGGTFIGNGYYRGVRRPVVISKLDRRRHVYMIGKTGVGKSVLLQDMAMQDIRAGYGVCVIDPHGDLVENILRYIPPHRAEDVIYFDPADSERPMGLNLLEVHNEQEKYFISASIINLMYKLYDPQRTGIIGPRFEHSIRNAMLTVMSEPGTTFVEIVRVLTDSRYVDRLLPKVKDPMVRRYWTDQIANTNNFHKSEILDYIVSKFGRFVTNKLIRNIIGQSKSSFDFRQVMDSGKILLINLSKGKLGEENSSFLGLVLIPKILLAAMSRQEIPEDKRRDFFLYVDEFQNFATPDFATILSEARKYRLNLTVANQFIGQMEEEVKNAIFGNVGTLISFRIGVTDASYVQREFQPVFSDSDLINIDRYHAYMKTTVHNEPMPPFSVDMTKDMRKYKALANEKIARAVVQLSRLKYGRPEELVAAEISQRSNL